VFLADEQAARGYGPLTERAAATYADNDRMLDAADAPDARDVADAVARLVATPPGRRPLRTLVGGPMTQLVEPINETTATVQQQLLGFIGLTELTRPPATR